MIGRRGPRCVGRNGAHLAVLALVCAACHQSDYVARRPPVDGGKPMPHDAGYDSGATADSGADSGAPFDAGSPESVDSGSDSGSDPGSDADAMPPRAVCHPHACAADPSHDQLCDASAPLLSLGDSCAADSGNPSFRFALCSCAGLVTNGPLYVDGINPANLAVGGDVSFNAAVQIAGALQISGTLMTSGANAPAVMVANGVTEHANAACACDADRVLDIAGLVEAHRNDHDDDKAGLTPDSLGNYAGGTTQVLPCGRYYFQRIAGSGRLELQAQGNVAIFVDGDVQLQDEFVIDTSAGAHVTLVVNGGLVASHGMTLGSLDRPNDVLLAIGGPGNVNLDQMVTIGGSLYAPNAQLVTRGPLEVAGSLFVQRAQVDQELRLHYEPPAADSCQ